MSQKLKDKVVVITGASSGIGRSLAIECARNGASVVCSARRLERLHEVVDQCKVYGGKAIAVKCDVSIDSDVSRLADIAIKEMGKVDIIVGNAGASITGKLSEVSIADYSSQFETNFLGIVRLIKAFYPNLRKASGNIVLLGSLSGEIALPESTPYSVSKHSVHALAQGLYYELAPEGISVTLAIPGYVDTEIRKLNDHGVYDPMIIDPVSTRLLTSPGIVARKIISATVKRKQKVIIGIETKIAIFLNKYFPIVIRILRRLNIV